MPGQPPTLAAYSRSSFGLRQGTKIAGGTVLSGWTQRSTNRAAQTLRLAASALRTSPSVLGAYFRRLGARMDKTQAVTSAAHQLARPTYTMWTHGEEYTDKGQDCYEERCRERVLWNLTRRAENMGMRLVASEATV